MKQAKTKSCKNCAACGLVYRKSWYRFYREWTYYCTARDEFADPCGVCERWRKKNPEYDLSAQRFDEVQKDIERIMEILNST